MKSQLIFVLSELATEARLFGFGSVHTPITTNSSPDFNFTCHDMPIYKYKTFDGAERALWNFHPDEAYYKQVAALWRFANQLSPHYVSERNFQASQH